MALVERLAFNQKSGVVMSRRLIEVAIAHSPERAFATVPCSEPRDWGYVGLLAFTAVLLLRPQDQLEFLRPLHLAEVCALIGLAPMLFHRMSRGASVFRITPETTGLICFGLIMLATVPFSVWPGGALEEVTGSYLKAFLVFILIVNTVTTPKRLEQLSWLIVVSAGYVAARGVFDYARGINLIEGGRLAGAVGGIFGNPNDLALNMVTFMPIAAIVAMSRWQPPWRRTMAAVIVVLMMATTIFSQSRSGAVGLVVMLGALLLMGRRVRPNFAPIVLSAVLAATPFMPGSFWARMASIFDEQADKQQFTGSRETRRILLQEGIAAFLEHPLTGVGAGQFKNYNPTGRKERWGETHNALIQVGAETGLLGLLLFSFLIARAGWAAGSTRRMLGPPRRRSGPDLIATVLAGGERRILHAHAIGTTAALIGWFTCAMFASVVYGWTFYYLLGLIIAARELTRDRLAVARALQAPAASAQ